MAVGYRVISKKTNHRKKGDESVTGMGLGKKQAKKNRNEETGDYKGQNLWTPGTAL